MDAVESSIRDLSDSTDWLEEVPIEMIEQYYDLETLRILGDLGPEARQAIPALERLRAAAPAGPLRAAVEEALRKVAQPRA